MSNSIVIMGPKSVGKSTLATNLSELLGKPRCCLDEIQWDYFRDTDFNHERAKKLIISDLDQFLDYSAPYLVYVVERVLEEHTSHIIDFGAGHTCFDTTAHTNRVKKAFHPITRSILLLPSKNIEESLDALPGPNEGMRLNPTFIKHPFQRELAKHVIYTIGKTPAEITDEARDYLQEYSA